MERRGFGSSEEFARSLEPHYQPEASGASQPEPVQETPDEQPQEPVAHAYAKRVRPRDPHAHHRRKSFEVFSAAYLFVLLIFFFLLSMCTDVTIFKVLFAFLPTIFTIVLAMVIYESERDNKNLLWVIPLVLIFAFHWFGKTTTGFFGDIDVDTLTGLNIVFSFLYLIINYFLLQRSGKPEVVVKEVIKEKMVEQEPEDISQFIASIEDKGKALNFVIGRVYNAYHGGSKDLRNKINMKQEWYDQFSQIPADPAKIDFGALKSLISTIKTRLKLLESSEVEVFGLVHKEFKNLVRNEFGRDKVIEVLDRNDKDPVKSYVEGAMEFCEKIESFIQKRQAPAVENEYVSKETGEKKAAPRSSTWDTGSVVKK